MLHFGVCRWPNARDRKDSRSAYQCKVRLELNLFDSGDNVGNSEGCLDVMSRTMSVLPIEPEALNGRDEELVSRDAVLFIFR